MAKFIDVEQGTAAWLEARRGIPTASCFYRIVTPTGKMSAQSTDYACLLIAERMLGRSLVDIDYLDAIARGKALEPEAISLYEFDRNLDTHPVGLVVTDDGRIGASPDRLVGDDGLLEVKSPLAHSHVKYMLFSFGNDYRPQRQGQIWVTERDWIDLVSYSPELPPHIERHYRDDAYIATLADSLNAFADRLDELTEMARSKGIRPYVEPKRERAAATKGGPSLAEMQRRNEAGMRLYAP